jgi:MFS family permease
MKDTKGVPAGAEGSESGVLSILADNFTILRNRDIRVYLSGNAVSLIGDWMQQTAQAWVVWELTHSTTALGIVAFFSQIPFFIFGPWVGVISDRYDRRKILLVTQTLIMLFAFILAALVQWHLLQLWHVYVLALLLGIVTAFDVTAEQAFMSDIAGAGNIRKAVAVNNSLTQLTRLVGPSIAGLLISRVGIAPSFWINGLTIIITIICIISVRTRRESKKEAGDGLKQFNEGWRFFRKHGLLRLIMIFAAAQAFFGFSVIQLLPAVASVILKGDASTLGKLLAGAGAGALVGIVLVMPFVERIKKPCMAIGGALMWSGIWYILFSRFDNLYLAMLCQFMASLGGANVVTLSIGLVQELTPPGMRARIVSTFLMIIFGLQPLASYLAGEGASRFGLQPVILVNGILMVLIPAVLLTLPKLNQLRRPQGVLKGQDRCVGF